MKSKIITIALILGGYFLAAQVPNTETFTLDTVVKVVNPTTDDLQDCFNDAIPSYFDPAYASPTYPANSLLIFRNYGNLVPPTIITEDLYAIDYQSFYYQGNVTAQGSANVTERGVVYGAGITPVYPTNAQASGSSGAGSFNVTVTGLSANTAYNVRGYAVSSVGVSYTGTSQVTTPSASPPTVTTNSATGITVHGASFTGTLNTGTGITNYGFNIYASDQTTLRHTINNASSFSGSIDNLNCFNTQYYVEAFATNSAGTGYGSKVAFGTATQSTFVGYMFSKINTISVTDSTSALNAINNVFANGISTLSTNTSYLFSKVNSLSAGKYIYPSSDNCFYDMGSEWRVWFTGSIFSNGQKITPLYILHINTSTEKIISVTQFNL